MKIEIEINGCSDCLFTEHTSDDDWDCGIFCTKNRKISWTEEEFLNLPMDYMDENCLLEEKNKIVMTDTDKEKAMELCGACKNCTFSCGDRLNCKVEDKYNIAIKMAQWKEQQFQKFIDSLGLTMQTLYNEYKSKRH